MSLCISCLTVSAHLHCTLLTESMSFVLTTDMDMTIILLKERFASIFMDERTSLCFGRIITDIVDQVNTA